MTTLRVERLRLENFRCFEALDVSFEPDLTVFFAENSGGKSALLSGLAATLNLLQPRHSKEHTLDVERDCRQVRGAGDRREPSGVCKVSCTAEIGGRPGVTWSVELFPASGKRTPSLGKASEALEKVRQPGERWPLLAYYGTGRFTGEHKQKKRKKGPRFQDRWDGYEGCFDSSASDEPLLEWLRMEAFGDLARHRRGEPERLLERGVLDALKKATEGLEELQYDPARDQLVGKFANGSEALWSELSDGYHVFMSLVGDIARRAVILNGQDGADAPDHIEGVILIDEIDLHLHPRWQRDVLRGLRAAFPKLQLIVSTHSPQVLSSVENRQVRPLVDWKIREGGARVEGRDSNSILRDYMNTEDRDARMQGDLDRLYRLIEDGDHEGARALLSHLKTLWGRADPEVIRADRLLDDSDAEGR